MLQTILSGRTRFLTHLIGWVLLALLIFSLVSGLRSITETIQRTLLSMLFLISLFYLNGRVLINRFFETGRYRIFVPLVLAVWLGASLLRVYLEKVIFGGSIIPQQGQLPVVDDTRLFVAFSIAFFLLLLFSSLYQLLENRLALELRNRELEAQHTAAQLNYLKAQINPHFLFNTLNNIYAAASLQHPNTSTMILRLSDLLRYVTYDGQQTQVPLKRELEQIEAYLDLFQLKSEGPLQIDIKMDDTFPGRHIEPVLLLPLVENAVKHGDLGQHPDAYLSLKIRNTASTLHFQIENSFDETNTQKDQVGGVGLDNIQKRLALLYPGRHSFEVNAAPPVFTATLILHAAVEATADSFDNQFN